MRPRCLASRPTLGSRSNRQSDSPRFAHRLPAPLVGLPPLQPRAIRLSVFVELRFWALVVFSLVLPAGIYGLLLATRSISRAAVLGFCIALVLISGVDVYLLQSLATVAKSTPSLADDAVFISELSIALCFLPVVFGGIGVNLISHVLLRHLTEAEMRFDREHPDD